MLKDSRGRTGTGLRQNKTRSFLVVTEVGLAVVLLVGSALLIRSDIALGAIDPGFDARHVLTMSMVLTGPRYATSAALAQTVRDGVERVRAVPGVVNASATCCVPLQGGFGLPFTVVGRPLQGSSTATGNAGWATISPGFFDVFKIVIKSGRAFTERDNHQAPAVVIINESMARQYWKDSDPLRDRLVIGRCVMKEFKDEPDRQIVGVVSDVRDRGLNNDPGPTVYIPQAQETDAANALNLRIAPMAWVVRTEGDPRSLAPAIQEQLRQSTGLPVADVYPMEEVVSLSTARQRLNMLLMTIFGCCAAVLAAIGIYGVMAYSVEQRANEMGIRVALGAEAAQVKGMVVIQGLGLAVVGVVIGLGSAFGLTRLLASFLFGVKAHDPLVFVLVPLLLSAVALAAVWIPASRASAVDPIQALRNE
jgi:putative ABC transport system permease protein